MKSRFEKYINKLEIRKEQINQTKVHDTVFFGDSQKFQKLRKIEKLLNHLKKYEEKTSALIQENSENQKFYESHFEAVVCLLEEIDAKKPSELVNKDFKLVLSQDVRYKKNWLEMLQEIGLFHVGSGAIIGGIIGFFIAQILAYTLPPLWGLQITLVGSLLFSLAGLLAGALIGGLIGLIVGCCIVPFQKESLLKNEYQNGSVFDSSLLKETYAEMYTGCGNFNSLSSANDQNMEVDEEIENTKPSF